MSEHECCRAVAKRFQFGPSHNNSLVAVSSGLLEHMSRDEVQAVLAHEVSHVANGDMVTLIQGVVNTFVITIAKIVGYLVDRALNSNSDEEHQGLGMGYWVTSIIAEILLGFLSSTIVMWFSRGANSGPMPEVPASRGAAVCLGHWSV